MLLDKLRQFVKGDYSKKETDPRQAYNLWANGYDAQPGNLMLDLDEIVFSGFLNEMDLREKRIADIGCGTGRHWTKILTKNPGKLIGFDVSEGMLKKLEEKFSGVETNLLSPDNFIELPDKSCDLVCSTLTIAHIMDLHSAMSEWHRVLVNGGDMIITDYHPATLQKGGQRTFKHKGRVVAVKNYIHTIDDIRELARQLGFKEIRFVEKIIDESVRKYYEQQAALDVYEKYKGAPVIYGIHFKKER